MRRNLFLTAAALIVLVACGSLATTTVRAQDDGQNLPRITMEEFKQLLAKNAIVVLDVRGGGITEKIKGAAHIPENELQARLKELPRDREIVTYCA